MILYLPEIDREAEANRVREYLLICLPGKRLEVTIEADKPERSSKQNRALFGHAYRVIREQTGADKDDLHRDFCIAFFGLKLQTVLSFEHRQPLRTTTHNEHGKRDVIDAEEFSKFYGEVERKAAEFGIYIPAPDPRWFLNTL